MVQKTAITDIFKSLAEVESRFGIRRTEDEQFFGEWYENLPQITDEEKASLDVIRRRYLYHLADGNLTEGTVTLLIGSPILEKAGFYDYPYKMRGEASIEIVFDADEEEETLKGRIDILVLQNQFWVILLESKRTIAVPIQMRYNIISSRVGARQCRAPTGVPHVTENCYTISVMSALPQTLAYMMANPQPDKPIFGMMTNGDGIIFVKLTQQDRPQYDISRVFSPAPLQNELYTVLQILKRIGQIIVSS
ncbi:type I restriction endonuclease subunit R [Tolypothrix sp. VBCCA 56010]|uniref:type I restriction endonuclease subunit R n=1 Tax=Tolypothrix sp. VBCCA 56010 TaxID=3137731 RepID=UPI003D7CB26D